MKLFGKDLGQKADTKPVSEFPDEATMLKYLNHMTPEDIDHLVQVARNQYETGGKQSSQSMDQYYHLLGNVFNNSMDTVGSSPYTRNQRYDIYDEMDESTAYISSALDILSDDATQMVDNEVIHIESDSEKVTSLVLDFIKEYELDSKISKWTRAVAKYGDLFVKVVGEYGRGITSINDTIYPGSVERRDIDGKLVAFSLTNNISNESLCPPWEYVHFRHKGDFYKSSARDSSVLGKSANNKVSLTSAYGQSVLRASIKVYAQLRFVENMLLLSRLTNSIRRNIFLINVGEVSPDKAFDTISTYARLLKKDVTMDVEEGVYNSAKHTINYDEDIFLPVGDPQNDVRIEQIGGDVNISEQYDLVYLLNKLFAALKVPKAYLNYEQDLNARSTLIQLDIRYARSVSQLQNTMVAGLKRLINTHLAYMGLNPDEIDLEISLTSVSAIDDEARGDQYARKIENARTTWDLLTSIGDTLSTDPESSTINMTVAAEHVMTDYLGLDSSLVSEILGIPSGDQDSTNESTKVTKSVRKKRASAIADGSAMYPTPTHQVEYQRLRESLLLQYNEEHITETISKRGMNYEEPENEHNHKEQSTKGGSTVS